MAVIVAGLVAWILRSRFSGRRSSKPDTRGAGQTYLETDSGPQPRRTPPAPRTAPSAGFWKTDRASSAVVMPPPSAALVVRGLVRGFLDVSIYLSPPVMTEHWGTILRHRQRSSFTRLSPAAYSCLNLFEGFPFWNTSEAAQSFGQGVKAEKCGGRESRRERSSRG